MKQLLTLALLLTAFTLPASADDWPAFRGPLRTGLCKEAGLLAQWPDGGPKLLWTASDLGGGYSAASIADGKIYITGLVGQQGTLFCLDDKGALLWKQAYGPEYAGRSRRGGPARFAGARSTPTVHDGRAFILSGQGTVYCFDATSGKRHWSLDVLKTFRGPNLRFGVSESLLIEAGKLIVTPGGENASVIALDPKDGKLIWKSEGLSHASAYCSPIAIDHGDIRMIVTHTSDALVGIAPDTGKVLWQHAYKNMRAVHPNTPIYVDGFFFVSSGYGHGSAIIKLDAAGAKTTEVWRKKILDTHHGGLVLREGHVYGTSSQRPKNQWLCLDVKTGEVKYEARGIGKGAVIAAGDKLYCYGENGVVALAQADPKGFSVISQFEIKVGEGEHWAHPSIANGVLYIRHGSKLQAYAISK